MGLFKELMNAVENRLYGTGATATAKENNGVQMILIQTGSGSARRSWKKRTTRKNISEKHRRR